MKRPVRRHSLTIHLHADTPKEMSSALEQVLFWWFEHLQHDGKTMAGLYASGGVLSGWTAEHVVDPAQTHDRYFEQLEAWRAAQDKASPAEDGDA